MQTFFSNMSFARTFKDLDSVRLGKQRLEVRQIHTMLTRTDGGGGGYRNHPVNFMWRGYEDSLLIYGMLCCMEWSMKRGFEDNIFWELYSRAGEPKGMLKPDGFEYRTPPWFRDKDVIRSHRSNLIRKDPGHYGPLYPHSQPGWPYLWPVTDDEGGYVLKVSKADKLRISRGERELPDDVAARVENL